MDAVKTVRSVQGAANSTNSFGTANGCFLVSIASNFLMTGGARKTCTIRSGSAAGGIVYTMDVAASVVQRWLNDIDIPGFGTKAGNAGATVFLGAPGLKINGKGFVISSGASTVSHVYYRNASNA